MGSQGPMPFYQKVLLGAFGGNTHTHTRTLLHATLFLVVSDEYLIIQCESDYFGE